MTDPDPANWCDRAFPNWPTVLVYVSTDSSDHAANWIGARILQAFLLSCIEPADEVHQAYFTRMDQGYLVGLSVTHYGPVLRGLKSAMQTLTLEHVEIAWWDPSELVIRDFHKPAGLPFSRLLPEIIKWHEHCQQARADGETRKA